MSKIQDDHAERRSPTPPHGAELLHLPFVPEPQDLVAVAVSLRGRKPTRVLTREQAANNTEEDTSDEPTWTELFQSEISGSVIRQILTKPIFGVPARKTG